MLVKVSVDPEFIPGRCTILGTTLEETHWDTGRTRKAGEQFKLIRKLNQDPRGCAVEM